MLGTLTKNDQTVTEAYVVDETVTLDPSSAAPYPGSISPALKKAVDIGVLCNNASLVRNEDGVYAGQATDVALLNVLDAFGLPDRRSVSLLFFVGCMSSDAIQSFERLSERPFNSEQKFMAVSGIHRDVPPSVSLSVNGGGAREMYYIKGSIEAILDRCRFYYVTDDSTPALDGNTRQVILSKAHGAASRGLRVLAMAYGYGCVEPSRPGTPDPPSVAAGTVGVGVAERTNLVFAGFQAMLDPPRKGVADSIGLLQSAGVQVVMITGDSEQTALSIGQKLGLRVGRGGGGEGTSSYCLTGRQIDQMTKGQLKERVGNVSVFARTTPRHKMAIVEAYQSRGAVVAMTGDGGGSGFFFLFGKFRS